MTHQSTWIILYIRYIYVIRLTLILKSVIKRIWQKIVFYLEVGMGRYLVGIRWRMTLLVWLSKDLAEINLIKILIPDKNV